MTTNQRDRYATRDRIMKLLSDDEVAKVSMAETEARLSEGDEYIDMEKVERGVIKADGVPTPMGRVLPRKSVKADTWLKIVEAIGGTRAAARSGALATSVGDVRALLFGRASVALGAELAR